LWLHRSTRPLGASVGAGGLGFGFRGSHAPLPKHFPWDFTTHHVKCQLSVRTVLFGEGSGWVCCSGPASGVLHAWSESAAVWASCKLKGIWGITDLGGSRFQRFFFYCEAVKDKFHFVRRGLVWVSTPYNHNALSHNSRFLLWPVGG
jgi:hypothetical protein